MQAIALFCAGSAKSLWSNMPSPFYFGMGGVARSAEFGFSDAFNENERRLSHSGNSPPHRLVFVGLISADVSTEGAIHQYVVHQRSGGKANGDAQSMRGQPEEAAFGDGDAQPVVWQPPGRGTSMPQNRSTRSSADVLLARTEEGHCPLPLEAKKSAIGARQPRPHRQPSAVCSKRAGRRQRNAHKGGVLYGNE